MVVDPDPDCDGNPGMSVMSGPKKNMPSIYSSFFCRNIFYSYRNIALRNTFFLFRIIICIAEMSNKDNNRIFLCWMCLYHIFFPFLISLFDVPFFVGGGGRNVFYLIVKIIAQECIV